jgi:TolB-like protein
MAVLIYRDSPQMNSRKANPPQAVADYPDGEFPLIIQSLAVLPFTNLSSNPDLDFFLTGLQETTITELAKADSLKVVSRPETLPYAGIERPLDDIANELGVQALLLGTIQEAGNWIRVSVQLLDRYSDRHLWAESFDREYIPDEAFNLQSEISGAISLAMKRFLPGTRTGDPSGIPTKNPAALEAYNKGRHAQNRGTRESRAEAEGHYLEAIDLDPGFALAKASLAHLYTEQILFWDLDPSSVTSKQQGLWDQAWRAIQMDDTISLAYVPLALSSWVSGDPTQAKEFLERAYELDPKNAFANIARVWLYTEHFGDLWMVSRIVQTTGALDSENTCTQFLIRLSTSDPRERHGNITTELERDPHSVVALISMGSLYHFYYNQYDEALSWYLKALELAPDASLPYLRIAMILDRLGKPDEASAWLMLRNVRVGGRRLDAMGDSAMLDLHREQAVGIDFINSSAQSINAFGRSLSERLEDLINAGEYERALEVCKMEVPELVGSIVNFNDPSLFRVVEDPFMLNQGNVLDISLEDRASFVRKAIASRVLPPDFINSLLGGSNGVFTFYMKLGRPKPEGRFPHTNTTWGLLDLETLPIPLDSNFLYREYSVLMRSFEDGFIDIRDGDRYTTLINEILTSGTYYQIWLVVNQLRNTYDVYIQGGAQFPKQTLIQRNAAFRKRTDAPLNRFLIVNDLLRGCDPIYMDDLYIFPDGQNLDHPSSDWLLLDDFEDGNLDGWRIVGWTDYLLNDIEMVLQIVRVLQANGLQENAGKLLDIVRAHEVSWSWGDRPWERVPRCRIAGLEEDRAEVLAILRSINKSGYAERNFGRYPEFEFIRDDPEFQQLVGEMEARLDAQLARVEQMQSDGIIPIPFE